MLCLSWVMLARTAAEDAKLGVGGLFIISRESREGDKNAAGRVFACDDWSKSDCLPWHRCAL